MGKGSAFEGGQVAFIGFLYQMIVAIGLQCWATVAVASSGQDELDAMIVLTSQSVMLHNLDANQQLLVLQGQPSAMHHLARQFLQWFIWKARQRQFRGMQAAPIHAALQAIARTCHDHLMKKPTYAQWIAAAANNGTLSERQAAQLYSESVSAGLILLHDAQSWWWRHPLVGQYLQEVDGYGI